jgi:hypothetical protein
MQRIIHTTTRKNLWRGPEYLVDGQPGVVESPLALLDEVADAEPDITDTQTVEWSEGPDLVAMTCLPHRRFS